MSWKFHSLLNPGMGTINYTCKENRCTYYYPCENQENCSGINLTLLPGQYLLECWGASGGGDHLIRGGKGAYTSGVLILENIITLYVFIGAAGMIPSQKSFNGGGFGHLPGEFSGGGATDIRIIPNSAFEGFLSRIMVAGGGGGSTNYHERAKGGDAGVFVGENGDEAVAPGYESFPAITVAQGGNQFEGGLGSKAIHTSNSGAFGYGGDGIYNVYASGGGGGYYGGGGGNCNNGRVGSGAGGSSFISGYPGCMSKSSLSTSESIQHNNHPYHFSNIVFSSPKILALNMDIPNPIQGNNDIYLGNGVFRISLQQQICSVCLVSVVIHPTFNLLFLIIPFLIQITH